MNTRKGISIIVEDPFGTLKLNDNILAVYIQYYGKGANRDRVTYCIGSISSAVATDPNSFVTKSFTYYLY